MKSGTKEKDGKRIVFDQFESENEACEWRNCQERIADSEGRRQVRAPETAGNYTGRVESSSAAILSDRRPVCRGGCAKREHGHRLLTVHEHPDAHRHLGV